jgi:hypothetical protein
MHSKERNLIICPISLVIKATETRNNIGRTCSARGMESCLRRNFRRIPLRGKNHQAGQLRIMKNTCVRETEFGVD